MKLVLTMVKTPAKNPTPKKLAKDDKTPSLLNFFRPKRAIEVTEPEISNLQPTNVPSLQSSSLPDPQDNWSSDPDIDLFCCPKCGEDCSGSKHVCFNCLKPSHAMCDSMNNPIEGSGCPVLCKSCFSNDK